MAAQLSTRRPISKLALSAPFNSMTDMARLNMPIFPFPALVRDKYESDKALEDLSIPILWLHGTHDRVVPISQGQKLYDGYSGPKDHLIIKGAYHSNIWISGGREAITDFIKS